MALSRRPPSDPHGLFALEYKPFEPALAPGDRLGFTLRVNPVVARAEAPGQRGKRHDVVMDALRGAEKRADARPGAIVAAGRAWLARPGEAYGFEPAPGANVDGYDRVKIPRSSGAAAVFGMLDISGVIVLRDPAAFLARLASGFGRARAFGCGLMLIRRAR
jgi:CRISPR system Cascade subunit CasE